MAASEGSVESGNVLTPLHRQCRHLQTGDPTFGWYWTRTESFNKILNIQT